MVGDRVIREVAHSLRVFVGAGRAAGPGVVARTGGEEFTVLVPVDQCEAAADVGGRLPLATVGTDGPPVTLSAGVVRVDLREIDESALAAAITEADRLMYDAKRRGGARAAVR